MNLSVSSFLVIGDNIYALQKSLLGLEGACSLWNVETLNWLRHCEGKVTESAREDSELFLHDASFVVHELADDYIWLSCTNDGMKDMNIYHDRRLKKYILRPGLYSAFFLYSYAEMKMAAVFLQRCDALERRLLDSFRGA